MSAIGKIFGGGSPPATIIQEPPPPPKPAPMPDPDDARIKATKKRQVAAKISRGGYASTIMSDGGNRQTLGGSSA